MCPVFSRLLFFQLLTAITLAASAFVPVSRCQRGVARTGWLQLLEFKLCDFWKSQSVTGKPHRIALAVSRYDRKRTGGLGADPDTAIHLKSRLGGPLGGSILFGAAIKHCWIPPAFIIAISGEAANAIASKYRRRNVSVVEMNRLRKK